MRQPKSPLAQLLPRGAMKQIAKQLGISSSAVTVAIRKGTPSHPAVAHAVRIVKESGVIATRDAIVEMSG